MPPEIGGKNEGGDNGDGDRQRRRVPDRGGQDEDFFAEPIGERAPESDPERRTDTVEYQKPPPRHAKAAGGDAIELPGDDDEARDDDRWRAIALDEAIDLGETLGRHADA